MNNILYTVGHSQHKLEYFQEMLQTNGINFVLDVRSTPYSQFAPDYNRENIKVFLKKSGIGYSFMGNYFGARQEDKRLYTKEGYLDFERTRKSFRFQAGVQNVMKGISEGNKVVLMCTEKDPIECHRAIMVARTFYEAGVPVEHILPDGSLESQEQLNEELVDLYFPDRHQISLFSTENRTQAEYLKKAYELQNRKIGYHMQEDVELARM